MAPKCLLRHRAITENKTSSFLLIVGLIWRDRPPRLRPGDEFRGAPPASVLGPSARSVPSACVRGHFRLRRPLEIGTRPNLSHKPHSLSSPLLTLPSIHTSFEGGAKTGGARGESHSRKNRTWEGSRETERGGGRGRRPVHTFMQSEATVFFPRCTSMEKQVLYDTPDTV